LKEDVLKTKEADPIAYNAPPSEQYVSSTETSVAVTFALDA
jgi:hypothetical protein